jgi:hypothetical protein
MGSLHRVEWLTAPHVAVGIMVRLGAGLNEEEGVSELPASGRLAPWRWHSSLAQPEYQAYSPRSENEAAVAAGLSRMQGSLPGA